MKGKIKLTIKTFVPLIGYFLSKFKRIKNQKIDNRILIIFGGGVGDVVKITIICEFIKKYLNDFEVYYLLPYKLKFPYAKEILYFDYTKAKINPFYFTKLSENLKNFGFSKVIVLLPFWENFLWTLGLSVGPKTLYVYDETSPSNFESFLNKIYRYLFIFSLRKIKKIKVWSYFDKNWPVENFAKVSKYLKDKKILEIVVVGGKESKEKVKKFEKLFGENFINLVSKTDPETLCILIKNAKMVLANDTSFIHIGIAFKTPTICPIMNNYLGVDTLYGYQKINKWVFDEEEKSKESLDKLSPERVIEEIEKVLKLKLEEKDKFLLFYNV